MAVMKALKFEFCVGRSGVWIGFFLPELGYFPDSIIPPVLRIYIHSSTIDTV